MARASRQRESVISKCRIFPDLLQTAGGLVQRSDIHRPPGNLPGISETAQNFGPSAHVRNVLVWCTTGARIVPVLTGLFPVSEYWRPGITIRAVRYNQAPTPP